MEIVSSNDVEPYLVIYDTSEVRSVSFTIKATTLGKVSAETSVSLFVYDYSQCDAFMIMPSYYTKTYHITNAMNKIYFGMWDSLSSQCPVAKYGSSIS
jgi:hypothetical protein